MMFGYMNENWEEEPDVEVGEHNFRPAKLTVQPTSCRDATGSRLVTVPSDWGTENLCGLLM